MHPTNPTGTTGTTNPEATTTPPTSNPPDTTGPLATAALPCWTPTRNNIKAWLERNSRSLAELYEGAVLLLYQNPIPGHVRFIAHAVREIRNRLPDAIGGPTKSRQVQYKNRLDKIAKMHGASTLIADIGGTTPPITTITVERKFGRAIATLLQDHTAAREKPIDAARRLFKAIAPENTSEETLQPILDHWITVTTWFEEKNHDTGHTSDYYQPQEVRQHFTLFENAIAAATRPFFDTLEDLDAILEDANQ